MKNVTYLVSSRPYEVGYVLNDHTFFIYIYIYFSIIYLAFDFFSTMVDQSIRIGVARQRSSWKSSSNYYPAT